MSDGHPTSFVRRTLSVDGAVPSNKELELDVREYAAAKIDEQYDGVDGNEVLITSVEVGEGDWHVEGRVVGHE